MKKGIVIFAHNNRQNDYAKLAIIAAKLANKNLSVPVSLITDPSTIDWMKESEIFKTAADIFDRIIITKRPEEINMRNFYDGQTKTPALFNNSNRSNVWDLTPYDRTLLIDSDYLIMSNTLNNYWNVDCDLMISGKYNDIFGDDRTGYHDKYISDTGIKLLWATTVMFTKNENTKTFFDLVEHIRENYKSFANLFRFDDRIYRNDISFSIAKHIMYGFETDNEYTLPDILSITDKDYLSHIDNNNLIVLASPRSDGNYCAAKISNDLHVMNKQSILRNSNALMELA
jgi:hypothetical protein